MRKLIRCQIPMPGPLKATMIIYFPSLFWRNVSPVDLYPENKETVNGKLNELLYDSIRRWELK